MPAPTDPLVLLDGTAGEGGGQILRTALALSMLTGRGFHMTQIRAGRRKPGLLRQHLTAVRAATEVCGAASSGANLGSGELAFRPGPIKAGNYEFSVGSAGSALLVLQTVLPALLTGDGASSLQLEGGTHNPMAPTYHFIQDAFLPVLAGMGASVTAKLHRCGFYPAGGGHVSVDIQPVKVWQPLNLLTRGELRGYQATAFIAGLPVSIAQRELHTLASRLSWPQDAFHVEELPEAHGPGNVLQTQLAYANVTEVITGFGAKNVTAEGVAEHVSQDVRRYLKSDAPVGVHLADQLLIPLALAGGTFRTLPLSLHATTNIAVIEQFLPVGFKTVSHGSAANVSVERPFGNEVIASSPMCP